MDPTVCVDGWVILAMGASIALMLLGLGGLIWLISKA